MSREEFIDGYTRRSGIESYRTDYGFHIPGTTPNVALPCRCGEEGCEGWAMIRANSVRWHLFQNGKRDRNPTAIHDETAGLEMARTYMSQHP